MPTGGNVKGKVGRQAGEAGGWRLERRTGEWEKGGRKDVGYQK